MSKTIVTLTGPTCSGKTTLQKMLQDKDLSGIVSFTTRNRREGEVEGKDYYFISKATHDVLSGIEIVEEVYLNNNHYGILKKEIERVIALNKNIVVVVDPNGVKQVNKFCNRNGLHHVSVYVDNTDFTIYKRFLERFYSDGEASVDGYAYRLINLPIEISTWRKMFPYSIVFSTFGPMNQDYVVNQILSEVKDYD